MSDLGDMRGAGLGGRAQLAAFGALAGLAGWVLSEAMAEGIGNARLVFFLAVLAGVFFADAMAMVGPMRPGRALARAALVALPVAALTTWASLRFDAPSGLAQVPHAWLAGLILAGVPVPFLLARETGDWRDYPTLFLQSWNVVVRYAAAWLFTGVVWVVLLVSDALFQLVGLDLIERLIAMPAFLWIFTGLVVGLAMAVVNELSDLVSPYLALRLLRILLPGVLVVVVVFLAALPLRGLSGLFGAFSAAGTLMAIGAGAVSLISIAVDARDAEAARSPVMRGAALALALTLPLLGGLAAFAVGVRVADYGWTPGRVAAAAGAVVVLGYGLTYAVAVLRGPGWMARIRRGNTVLALGLLALAALWLTPVLDAEAIAARSQVARFAEGRLPVARLPLVEMRFDWGRAGDRALARLEAMAGHPEAADLADRIALVRAAGDRWEVVGADDLADRVDRFAELLASATVLPEGAVPPDWFAAEALPWEYDLWLQGCRLADASGAPGCVLIVADFHAAHPGEEVMVLARGPGGHVLREVLARSAEGPALRLSPTLLPRAGQPMPDPAELFEALRAGDYRLGPPSVRALHVGGVEIVPAP